MENARIKCHQERCNREYSMEDIQRMLRGSPKVYTEIDRALAIKYMRNSEEYVSCPNKAC